MIRILLSLNTGLTIINFQITVSVFRQFMSSLNLDPAKLNFEPERLPQDLLEKCAAVSVRPNAIKDLTDAMGGIEHYKLTNVGR